MPGRLLASANWQNQSPAQTISQLRAQIIEKKGLCGSKEAKNGGERGD